MSSVDLEEDNDLDIIDDVIIEDIEEIEEIEEIEDIEEDEKLEAAGDIDDIDEDEFEVDINEDDEDDEDVDIDVLDIEENEEKLEIEDKITVPFITKYEYPKIISTRAQQIANGAPIFIDINDLRLSKKKPMEIAELELKLGKLNNIRIKRVLPNGKIEIRKLSELKFYSFY